MCNISMLEPARVDSCKVSRLITILCSLLAEVIISCKCGWRCYTYALLTVFVIIMYFHLLHVLVGLRSFWPVNGPVRRGLVLKDVK